MHVATTKLNIRWLHATWGGKLVRNLQAHGVI